MTLAPDLEDIYGSYEFCDEERRQLMELLEENNKCFANEETYADWHKANKMYEKLSNDARTFFNDYCDYVIGWKYNTQDIVDANNDIIEKLKKGD